MYKLFYTLLVATVLITNRGYSATENKTIALTIYVVSEEKIEGGRYIDTLDFQKVGYIAAKPDIIITKLVAVTDTVSKEFEEKIDINGQHISKPLPDVPALSVAVLPEDSQKIQTLTKKNIGRKVLFMLGDVPLIAPIINCPVSTKSFRITMGAHLDRKVIGDALKKLVR